MEHYQQSLSDLNGAIQQNSEEAKVIAHRGETYRLMESSEQALTDCDRAINLKPDYA